MDFPQAHLVGDSNWREVGKKSSPEAEEPPQLPQLGFTALISNMYLSTVGQPLLLTDVTFLLKDGLTRPAHRLLLALKSPYFKSKFSGCWEDQKDQVIDMTDIHEDTFSVVLHHIYSPGTVSMDHLEVTKLWDVYSLAEMFILPGLSFLVVRTLEKAIAKIEEKKYLFMHFQKAKVFNVLVDSIKRELLEHVGGEFNSDEFMGLPTQTVREILGWSYLKATEGQIFSAASAWSKMNTNSESEAMETFAKYFKDLIRVEFLSEDELVNIVIPGSEVITRATLGEWTKAVMINKPKKLFRVVNIKQKSFIIRLDWVFLTLLEVDGSRAFKLNNSIVFENTRVDGVEVFFSNEAPDQIMLQCSYAKSLLGGSIDHFGQDARFYVKYKTRQEGSQWIIRDGHKWLFEPMIIPTGQFAAKESVDLLITVDTRRTFPLRIVKLKEYVKDIDNASNLGEIKYYNAHKTLAQVAGDESGGSGWSRLWFVRDEGCPPIPITENQTIMGTTFRTYTVADMALYDAGTKSFFILEESSGRLPQIFGNRRILAVSLREDEKFMFLGSISVKTSGSFLKIDENFVKLVECKCRSTSEDEEGLELSIESPGKVKWVIHEGYGRDVSHLDSVTVRKFKLLTTLQENPFYVGTLRENKKSGSCRRFKQAKFKETRDKNLKCLVRATSLPGVLDSCLPGVEASSLLAVRASSLSGQGVEATSLVNKPSSSHSLTGSSNALNDSHHFNKKKSRLDCGNGY